MRRRDEGGVPRLERPGLGHQHHHREADRAGQRDHPAHDEQHKSEQKGPAGEERRDPGCDQQGTQPHQDERNRQRDEEA